VSPTYWGLFAAPDRLEGWTVVGAGNVGVVGTRFQQNGFAFQAADGQQYLDLTGLGTRDTGVQQIVATMPGATYRLTFWVGNVYNPSAIFGASSTVRVLVNGKELIAATNTRGSGSTTQEWQQFNAVFTAGAETTIAFVNGDPAGDDSNGLDNLSMRLFR
jgi:hypothetical protein